MRAVFYYDKKNVLKAERFELISSHLRTASLVAYLIDAYERNIVVPVMAMTPTRFFPCIFLF